MTTGKRRRGAGFTLLEVMAAVAILGIVYAVVARGAIQGLQVEGNASRRLRASLLADRALNDLELTLAAGNSPRVGSTEALEEEFTIVVDVTPFDIASVLLAGAPEGRPASGSPAAYQLLQPSARGSTPSLLELGVTVTWIEGVTPQEVTRTSFAFDLNAAAPYLEGLSEEEPEEAEEEAS